MEKTDVVFVVGNLPELGAWNHNQAIQLTRENDGSDSPSVFENSSSDFADYYGNSRDSSDLTGDSRSRNSDE